MKKEVYITKNGQMEVSVCPECEGTGFVDTGYCICGGKGTFVVSFTPKSEKEDE